MQRLLPVLCCLFNLISFGQNLEYSFLTIPKDLLESSNSVLRFEKHRIQIPNQSTIKIKHRRVITVLNKRGDVDASAYIHYDDVTRVNSVTAIVYDKLGNEIKEYKQRDFKDVSAVDGISLYTDSRLLYLDHTPTSYPYTLVIDSEITSKNTAYIPSFYANDGYFSSTQLKQLEIEYASELGLRYKTFGDTLNMAVKDYPGRFKIEVKNAPSITPEAFSPGFRNVVSGVSVSLDAFHLEGVDGMASDWTAFGNWVNTNLLNGSEDLPEETIATVQNLVKDLDDPVKKARAVYSYVQEKTRYISVQVGIGGWKPIKASQVDKLGYGDCKALTSYTKALLTAVGVPSYYTILYGGAEKRDIQSDFAAIQGNHAILSVPVEDDYIWLECTDQNVPFGFIAGFTDDRDVLIIKPNGGEIVHTTKYEPSDNFQSINGSFALDSLGNAIANVKITSGGLQYGDRYLLEKKDEKDQKKHYYRFWDYLNNVHLSQILLVNDKEHAIFTETVNFEVDTFASFAGNEMLIPFNLFNRYTSIPDRVSERKQVVDVPRGFKDEDEVTIIIPEHFEIVALPKNQEINTSYGRYSILFERQDARTVSYKRVFDFYEGSYEPEQYKDFRKFIRQVVRSDQQKLVVKKT